MCFVLFGCTRDCFVALRNSVHNGQTLMQKFVPRSRVRIFCNERTRSTPLDPRLTFWCILNLLGAFRTFGYLTKLGGKRADLVEKFVPRSCVRIFRNERTRFSHLDPKQMFWCVSHYLGAIGAVWLPYETRCKTGRTSAKVHATKSRRNFLQRTHPITPLDPN